MTISVKNLDSRQLNLNGEFAKDRINAIRDQKFEEDQCMVIDCRRNQCDSWHNLCDSHMVRPRYADPSEPVCPDCGFKYEDSWTGDICRECGTSMVVEDRFCMICGRAIEAFPGGHATDSLLICSGCYVGLMKGEKPEYFTEEIERAIRG